MNPISAINQLCHWSLVSTDPSGISIRGRHGMWVRCAFVLLAGAVSPRLVQASGLPPFPPLPSATASFLSPARVAADGQLHLLVSDPMAGKVVVLDSTGQELLAKSGLGQPLGLAVGEDGTIYVGDAKTGAVTRFDPQWNWIDILGQGNGEFQLPGHIATFTGNGVTTVFVSDGLAHQVKAYRDGVRVGQYGGYGIGPQQFDFPAGIWVATNGNLYVVDQNNDRVQVLDRGGNFLRWFTLQPSPQQTSLSGRAQGIFGDEQGWLYVADTFQDHVKVFELSGKFLGYVGGYGESRGRFRSPGGVVVDRRGQLWVANANNGRMEGFVSVYLPPILLLNRAPAGDLQLVWNDPRFALQSAPDLGGPWQTVAETSTFILPASAVASDAKQFFRLQRR
ncbi:MAG: NHL repeat-containing protein [Verrucomicrobia bacterium]|jgi:DNA-binding beta-propeller fold protein YncE|nr:NHL repeat-containing protein [Verrucomicrobiota bacterium]